MYARSLLALALLTLSTPLVAAQHRRLAGPGGTLVVVQTIPAAVSVAPVATSITVVFDRPLAQNTAYAESFRVSTDLGDLDGDGDLDWVVSSLGGGFWRRYRNNGMGGFSFWSQINAPSNPSCAILLDTDREGDLDIALTDEIADEVVLMENL